MSLEEAYRARCPSCDMLVDVEQSHAFMPFCSERCRLIDLGRWLNEEHAVTCDADDDESEEREERGSILDSGASDASSRRPPPKLPPGWHDA